MSDKKIKPEKNDLESNNMNLDDDEDDENIFDGEGNLDSEQNENKKDNKMDIDEDEDEDEEINDKDSWKVIRAYFKQHGLVSQQIGSFNQFVGKNIQEIIDENKTISIEVDTNYSRKDADEETKYELSFSQSRIAANPQFIEINRNVENKIFPNDTRVRNLDYLSELSLGVIWREKKIKC